MNEEHSTVSRVTYGRRETEATLLTADNTSVRDGPGGTLVLELFRYHAKTGKPVESFKFILCPEDRARLRRA